MNMNEDNKIDPVISETVHEEMFGKNSSHLIMNNRNTKVRTNAACEISSISPSRSFASDTSTAKDSYPSFHDDSKNAPDQYITRNEQFDVSAKAEETKDFAEVMKMVEKIQYLTEGFSVIAQNESMDIASFKCTSTMYEDRSTSIGSATPSTISLCAMLKETQELRVAAVSMAKKLKKRKGISNRSSRSAVVGSQLTKRELATAELERLVTSLERISLEVEGTIHKIVEGRDGEEIDSTASSLPQPPRGIEQLLQAETRDSVHEVADESQSRELAPTLDRDDYQYSSLESFSVDPNLDQEVKVTNMSLLDPSIYEVNDRLCPSPSLIPQTGTTAQDHFPIEGNSLGQMKRTSIKSIGSNPSHTPHSPDSPSPLSSGFSTDEKSKRSSKSTMSPLRSCSPLTHNSNRSIPTQKLEEYYSVVVIKDVDSVVDSNGMNSSTVNSIDLRNCNSESNISLRELAKPLTVRSLSAEAKLTSTESITSMSRSVQKQKEDCSVNSRDANKRNNYRSIISSILGDAVTPSQDTDNNLNSLKDISKDVNAELKNKVGKESKTPALNVDQEMLSTRYSKKEIADKLQTYDRPEIPALGTRASMNEPSDNLPTLGQFDGISQEFDYRDKYAVEPDIRNFTSIPAVYEKSERGTPFMETTTNTKSDLQPNIVSSSLPPISPTSKKLRSQSLSMYDPDKEVDGVDVTCSNNSKAGSSKKSTGSSKKSRFSIMSGDKPFWSRILRNKQVTSSKDLKRLSTSSPNTTNHQIEDSSKTLAEKRANRKSKVKMDIWNMIRGNKSRRSKQSTKESMDGITEVNEIPEGIVAQLVPTIDQTEAELTEKTANDMPRLIEDDGIDSLLQASLDELDVLVASNHSPKTSTNITQKSQLKKISDPREDQSADDDFGLIITITHDSDCEVIETSVSDSIDSYRNVEMNESYLLSKSNEKLVSSDDENSSFPSLLYPYLDPKRIGSKGRERQQQQQHHTTFFQNKPSYVLAKAASGSISSSSAAASRKVSKSRRNNITSSKYGIDKFSFLEPPEVPRISIVDATVQSNH